MATPPPMALWQCHGLPFAGYAACTYHLHLPPAVVRILTLEYQEMRDVQEGSIGIEKPVPISRSDASRRPARAAGKMQQIWEVTYLGVWVLARQNDKASF